MVGLLLLKVVNYSSRVRHAINRGRRGYNPAGGTRADTLEYQGTNVSDTFIV